MKRIIVFSVLALVIVACSKDKFQTKPTLKIKSTSATTVPVNTPFRIVFEFTDKEGDIDSIFLKKERTNQRQVKPTLRDSLKLKVPAFPSHDQGEIEVDLDYQGELISAQTPPVSGNPPVQEPDSLRLKFVLKDKAGNKSDTVTLNNIIVIR